MLNYSVFELSENDLLKTGKVIQSNVDKMT